MSKRNLRRLLILVGVALVLISLAAIIYGILPNPAATDQIMLEPTLFMPPGGAP